MPSTRPSKKDAVSHARRERALFDLVGVLDGRLGHADGLGLARRGRGREVDARGFVRRGRVGACERRVASMLYLSRPPRHGIISTPPGHRLSIPHRNAIAATLEKDAVSRTLRSSDRFGGRRVFFFWRRGFILRRFRVVLVRERVGGELRGGHGFGGLPRTDQQSRCSLTRAAAKKSTRVARRMTPSTAVFWGAGACGCFFAEKRSVCSRRREWGRGFPSGVL